ncbi:MAG: phenylalanine--tRNA ligase subunit alpha, partial [Rhizobiaceae bacterium]|nr:phenylalanine--tRNA ligase subunit alpha [Rhizobiaceae bacterium]
MSEIAELETEIRVQIDGASDEAALEAVRIASLGKKGSISTMMKTLGKMTPEERKVMGPALNGLKVSITDAIAARKQVLGKAAIEARLVNETLDVTLPLRPSPAQVGRIHPITQVTDEITAIFADMGFSIAEGPDIETDYYNFTALNFPEGHPAREMHDTFFFNEGEDGKRKVLR